MSVCKKGLSVKVADFIGLFKFEWISRNKVGNFGILVLRRDHESTCREQFWFHSRFFIRRFQW